MSVEYAESGRVRLSPYPEEWGIPQGRSDSETRAAWVRRMVDQHSALTSHRVLARKQGQLLVKLGRADLMRRKPGPVI